MPSLTKTRGVKNSFWRWGDGEGWIWLKGREGGEGEGCGLARFLGWDGMG